MTQHMIETHPLSPFVPPNARLLILGSFPPPKARWKMDFYYPNFQNDMWRIFGLVFFNEKDYFLSANAKSFKEKEIRDFLTHKGIAISDTAYKVQRLQGNAADKFLQIVAPVNLTALMNQLPACDKIMTTGELATETLLSLMPPNTPKPTIGTYTTAYFCNRTLSLYRMPSSSRAYPLALEKKAAAYKSFFAEIGLL